MNNSSIEKELDMVNAFIAEKDAAIVASKQLFNDKTSREVRILQYVLGDAGSVDVKEAAYAMYVKDDLEKAEAIIDGTGQSNIRIKIVSRKELLDKLVALKKLT